MELVWNKDQLSEVRMKQSGDVHLSTFEVSIVHLF